MTRTIADIMATELVTFTPETNIHKAIRVLLDKRLSGAPVTDKGGQLVGVLSKKDCLKIVLTSSYHQDWGGNVGDFMSDDVTTLTPDMALVEAAKYFLNSHFRRFPVVREGELLGQVSRHDVLRAIIDGF